MEKTISYRQRMLNELDIDSLPKKIKVIKPVEVPKVAKPIVIETAVKEKKTKKTKVK